MALIRRFAGEFVWLGGIAAVTLVSLVERAVKGSEGGPVQGLIDAILLWGTLILGMTLPIVSAFCASACQRGKKALSATVRVLLASVCGPLLMVVVMTSIVSNVDGGIGLLLLPMLSFGVGVVSLLVFAGLERRRALRRFR